MKYDKQENEPLPKALTNRCMPFASDWKLSARESVDVIWGYFVLSLQETKEADGKDPKLD